MAHPGDEIGRRHPSRLDDEANHAQRNANRGDGHLPPLVRDETSSAGHRFPRALATESMCWIPTARSESSIASRVTGGVRWS